ncbi:hypothetical protein K9M79_02985 [Candidatus Woesearchaeota archaeon]|nr:hypothetical protein [Candidatus Woesearchaeota archaeon]
MANSEIYSIKLSKDQIKVLEVALINGQINECYSEKAEPIVESLLYSLKEDIELI